MLRAFIILFCCWHCNGLVVGRLQNSPGDELFAWVHANGGQGLDNIRIAKFPKGEAHEVRGLAAAVDVSPGTELFSIPSKLVLTETNPLFQQSVWSGVSDRVETLPISLTLFLAAEKARLDKGGTSFWAPLVRSFPTEVDYETFSPYYARPELLEHFDKLPMVHDIKHSLADIRRMWDGHKTNYKKLALKAGVDDLEYSDFLWAWVTIAYRGYWFGEYDTALVPISDLANTGAKSNLEWQGKLIGSPPAWRLQAKSQIPKGHELLETYRNDVSNVHLLRHYGFVVSGNPVKPKALPSHDCDTLRQPVAPELNSQPVLVSSLRIVVQDSCHHVS